MLFSYMYKKKSLEGLVKQSRYADKLADVLEHGLVLDLHGKIVPNVLE